MGVCVCVCLRVFTRMCVCIRESERERERERERETLREAEGDRVCVFTCECMCVCVCVCATLCDRKSLHTHAYMNTHAYTFTNSYYPRVFRTILAPAGKHGKSKGEYVIFKMFTWCMNPQTFLNVRYYWFFRSFVFQTLRANFREYVQNWSRNKAFAYGQGTLEICKKTMLSCVPSPARTRLVLSYCTPNARSRRPKRALCGREREREEEKRGRRERKGGEEWHRGERERKSKSKRVWVRARILCVRGMWSILCIILFVCTHAEHVVHVNLRAHAHAPEDNHNHFWTCSLVAKMSLPHKRCK